MMTNLELFEYSGLHKEKLLDPYYFVDEDKSLIIPQTITDHSQLVENNTRLIRLIEVFAYFEEQGKPQKDPEVRKLIDEVCSILEKRDININLSPFSQFFMIYDSSHADFENYTSAEQRSFIYDMLRNYAKKRHPVYLSHGYTSSMLQAVYDNYSHKRKSRGGIEKILDMLKKCGFVCLKQGTDSQRIYFSPDKDKRAWSDFKNRHAVVSRISSNKQGKRPDMIFCIDDEYYVVEMKHVKGMGGGQDKQISELIDFIGESDQGQNVHFVSYLDGRYSNQLHSRKKTEKIQEQYGAIRTNLSQNPGNYFLNTKGLEKLLQQLICD